MKKLFYLLILTTFILPSCQTEQKYFTVEEIKKEEAEIVKVLYSYNKASEDKNFAELLKTLADSVVFFGSDQGEVIKTFADYKDAIQRQWEEYEYTKYGEITDLFIALDSRATIASVIYGVPLEAKLKNGIQEDVFLRASRTLRKQNEKWVIVSGITSIPRSKPVVQPQNLNQ